MSDMSRPPLPPTTPDHARHDPLLIAQFAAGDDLDPEQQRLAQHLATTCGECAALAVDLRAVSGAVAWEPVPPRRRDMRIGEAQSQQLRGGYVSRLMRRLAVPRAGSLRPAAAGVMSLGLLFIVAGAVWPFDSARQSPVAPASAPSQESVQQRARAGATAPAALFDDAVDGVAAPEARPQAQPDIDVDAYASDVSQKAARTRDIEPEAMGQQATEMTLDAGELAQDASEMAPDGTPEGDLDRAAPAAVGEPSPGVGGAVLERSALASPAAREGQGISNGAVGGLEPEAATALDRGSGIDIETVLVALGVVMAAGGALLLALVWLARRSTDPLLR